MEPDEIETLPLREDEDPKSEEIQTPLSEKERRRRHTDEVQILRDAEGEILLANAVQEYEDAREYERLNKPKPKCKKRIQKPKTTHPPDNLSQVYLLQESERRIRTLHPKLEHLRAMNEPLPDSTKPTTPTPHSYPKPSCSDEVEDTEDVHVLGDVHQESFKIDYGTNNSQ